MTQEQIKAKAKEYFPNDEFKQQIVIDAINWATEELQKENAELKEQIAELSKHIVELQNDKGELIDRCRELETRCNELFLQTCGQAEKIAELEAQIEEMKFDVKANIKWADEHENNQMYFKLNSMFNQWEIKEK